MNFFQKIVKSIYSPSFYAQILQKSLGSALGYFFLLCLLLSVVQSLAVFFGATVNHLQQNIERGIVNTINSYPSDLIITIHNGALSTNVAEPYMIPFPGGPNEGYKNLFVIDTKSPFSSTQLRAYETLAWVSKDTIFVAGENGQTRTIDLSKVSDFTLDKQAVIAFADKLNPWIKFVTPIFMVLIFIGTYILNALRLIYLFFLALLIMLITKLTKRALTYGESYRVGLFAMTTAFLVDLIAPFTHLVFVPFLFTLTTLAVVVINFLSLPTTTAPVKTPSKPKSKK